MQTLEKKARKCYNNIEKTKEIIFMKIAVACDHGGLNLKNAMIKYVEKLGHEVVDFGTKTFDSCDYPDFAAAAAEALPFLALLL